LTRAADYGDIYPRTDIGKILSFIASIIGMIIVSLIVVTVTNTLQMTNVEGKAFTVIKKLNIKN